MSKENGGPAFPELGNVACNSDWQSESGMTLRDYFAAKYMEGASGKADSLYDLDKLAEESYRMADEMLKARDI